MVQLPIGRGNMDFRIEYAVQHCKRLTQVYRGNQNNETWCRMFDIVKEQYQKQKEERFQKESKPYEYQRIYEEREEEEFPERESREDWEDASDF
jgi:hypothetical protein